MAPTYWARASRKDNAFATHIRRGILKVGIFHNRDGNAYDFEHALRQNFKEVERWVVGPTFVFKAENPKSDN